MKNQLNQSKKSGFTLLEILVALSIFSVIATMGYSGLNKILKLQERQEEIQQAQEDLQRALLIVSRDFYQMVPRPVRDNSGSFINAVSFDSNNNKIQFTRSGNTYPITFKQSSLQRIAYNLEDDKLYRTHWSMLDRPLSAFPSKYQLLENVTRMTLRFMSSGGTWSNFWNPASLTTMPKAIELTLEMKDKQIFLHTFPILK